MNVVETPRCSCGYQDETPLHYFLYCPNYTEIRGILINEINQITDVNIENLLYGNENLTLEMNKRIFDSVHSFIVNSNRFSN